MHRRERRDRLRLAVFEHDEIVGREPRHRASIAIEHRDVQMHQVDARSELRRARSLSGSGHDETGDDANDRQRPMKDHLTTVKRVWRRAVVCPTVASIVKR